MTFPPVLVFPSFTVVYTNRIFTCLTTRTMLTCRGSLATPSASHPFETSFVFEYPRSAHRQTRFDGRAMTRERGVNIICYNLHDFHSIRHVNIIHIKWTIAFRWYCFVEEAHLEFVWRSAKTWVKILPKIEAVKVAIKWNLLHNKSKINFYSDLK